MEQFVVFSPKGNHFLRLLHTILGFLSAAVSNFFDADSKIFCCKRL